MKKAIIISIFGGACLLGGCSSSFLDQDPPLYVNPGDVFTDADRIEDTLNGLYGSIKNTGNKSLLGGITYLVFDNRGDDLINVSSNSVTLPYTYGMNVGTADVENEDTWTYFYLAINKVNIFLEDLAEAKEVAGEKYAQYRQEALFVRAVCYYYLNNLYAKPFFVDPAAKSVPLRLTGERGVGNNNKKRETVAGIYSQILEDLSDISALPLGGNTYEKVTHATQAAAEMLKMRVYMSIGEWDNAIAAGKAVKGYTLPDDVAAIYNAPYYTEETIFSLPMALTNVPNTQQSLAEFYAKSSMIMKIDAMNGVMSKANYSLEGDKRIGNFKGEGDILLKFTDTKTKLQWVPIFRYAETLLNLAECYANKSGGEVSARELLKQVRRRSVAAGIDPLDIDHLSGNDLKEAIFNEKRLEFIGEGVRGIDIIRRGEHFIKNNGVETIDVGPDDRGYIWPVPQSELLLNGNINK